MKHTVQYYDLISNRDELMIYNCKRYIVKINKLINNSFEQKVEHK